MPGDWGFATPDEPTFAYLVIYDTNGIGGAWLDEDRAHEFAQATNSVVVKLPITADFRKEPPMTTIPRAELNAVAHRHGVDYDLDFDPTVKWVRATAKFLRSGAGFAAPAPAKVVAEADDLDALADRYEREMWSHTSGVNP